MALTIHANAQEENGPALNDILHAGEQGTYAADTNGFVNIGKRAQSGSFNKPITCPDWDWCRRNIDFDCHVENPSGANVPAGSFLSIGVRYTISCTLPAKLDKTYVATFYSSPTGFKYSNEINQVPSDSIQNTYLANQAKAVTKSIEFFASSPGLDERIAFYQQGVWIKFQLIKKNDDYWRTVFYKVNRGTGDPSSPLECRYPNECELEQRFDFPLFLIYGQNHEWAFSSIVPASGLRPSKVVISPSTVQIIGSNAIDFTANNQFGANVVINVPTPESIGSYREVRGFLVLVG